MHTVRELLIDTQLTRETASRACTTTQELRQLAWGLRTGRQIRERSLRIVGELEQVAIFAR